MTLIRRPKRIASAKSMGERYGYALMVGELATGCEFIGPFATQERAIEAWDERNDSGAAAAIVPLFFHAARTGAGIVHVTLCEFSVQVHGIYHTKETAREWWPTFGEAGQYVSSARIMPPSSVS